MTNSKINWTGPYSLEIEWTKEYFGIKFRGSVTVDPVLPGVRLADQIDVAFDRKYSTYVQYFMAFGTLPTGLSIVCEPAAEEAVNSEGEVSKEQGTRDPDKFLKEQRDSFLKGVFG